MTNSKKPLSKRRGRRTNPTIKADILRLTAPDPNRRDLLIEYLHTIQDRYGSISSDHIVALANLMKLSMSEVYEVATFYHHFNVVDSIAIDISKHPIRVCDSITCSLFGSEELFNQLQRSKNCDNFSIHKVSCVGRCDEAPVASLGKNTIGHATLETILESIKNNKVEPKLPDSLSFDSYCATGGYQTYRNCISGRYSVPEIIDMLEKSGLRGLGGAGFPCAKKWQILRNQKKPRLLAVNIDEGEPGTFKDRYYLERDPHRFLEGMLIAAWAISATTCYIYLRDEYAGCRQMLSNELEKLMKKAGFHVPPIELRRGAGAYICGEESAMIESIEGKRGMPRQRPPYIAEKGLFGKPTLAHNMETLFWIRDIIEKSPKWFAGHGKRGRKGLRTYSVSGRVKKPGVHIAPSGTSVNELIDNYCGGMSDGHHFYGYFPGGASGGILPAEKGDLPLDFDCLEDTGCFIGSAAVIILSNQDQAKNAALNAMRFFARESCGQCTPCRVGTEKASTLMSSTKWDIALLEDLASVMEDSSICGLGQAAANPMRSVIKYFEKELLEKG